jgi:hypothetical protein
MFKKLFMLLVLCLVCLGGYQLGRRPGSPDVVGELKTKVEHIDWQIVGRKANSALADVHRKLSTSSNHGQTSVPAPSPKNSPAPAVAAAPPQEIPQCW